MSFLAPLFLVSAAAAAIPIVLHLLKGEPEPRVKFAAVALLRRAPVERAERRQIRQILLLVLRVSALVLLAIAFARPFFPSSAAASTPRVTVIVLDTSYSLMAPGRFERARMLAKAAIARAPAGDLVGVVTFSDEAQTVAKPSSDRLLALSAVDRATASFGATRYGAGLAAAAASLEGRRATIVVVTDLQESGWDSTLDQAPDRSAPVAIPDSANVEVADVGPAPENLAITALGVKEGRVVATIRNTGSVPRDSRVRLEIDGKPVSDAAMSIGPGRSVEVALGAPAVRGTVAGATIEDRDGVQADNARFALIDGGTQASVLLVTATSDPQHEAFYVQHALKAASAGDVSRAVASSTALVGAADLGTWSADRLRPYGAVALLSTRGLERRGRELLAEFVRQGGGILIAAGPDVDGDVAGDVLGAGAKLTIAAAGDGKDEPRALVPADVRHPIFQPFRANPASLALVSFRHVARVGSSMCHDIARFTSGEVAVLDCAAGEGRALVFASDLDARWNDFPLHPAFVPFVHQVVQYLTSARTKRAEYLVGEAPDGVPRRPGVVELPATRDGEPARRAVINVDPREGDPSRMSADDFSAVAARSRTTGVEKARIDRADQEERQHVWRYLLALTLVVLAAEGMVAARTV